MAKENPHSPSSFLSKNRVILVAVFAAVVLISVLILSTDHHSGSGGGGGNTNNGDHRQHDEKKSSKSTNDDNEQHEEHNHDSAKMHREAENKFISELMEGEPSREKKAKNIDGHEKGGNSHIVPAKSRRTEEIQRRSVDAIKQSWRSNRRRRDDDNDDDGHHHHHHAAGNGGSSATSTGEQKKCSGSDFYSWIHPSVGRPHWLTDREQHLQTLAGFANYYANLPEETTNKYLRGGMQMEHQSTVWHVVKLIQPEVIIESGLWRGLGSRLIRHACPECMLYFFDPLTEKDRYHAPPPSKYLEGKTFIDIEKYDFAELTERQKRRTVILADDHFGVLERLRTFIDKGFANATVIFDDNYALPTESNFSPKQLFLDNECQWRPIPDGGSMSFQQVHYSMIASPGMMKRKQRLPRLRISKEEVERRRQQYRALIDWYVEIPPPFPQWPQSQQVQRERERLKKDGHVDRDATWVMREAPAVFEKKQDFWEWAGKVTDGKLTPDLRQTKWAGQLSNQMCAVKIHDFLINPADIRPVDECKECKVHPVNQV